MLIIVLYDNVEHMNTVQIQRIWWVCVCVVYGYRESK